MYEDICVPLGCCNPFHDHGEAPDLPELAKLVDTQDPAFENITKLLVDMNAASIALTQESVEVAIKLGRLYHTTGEPPAIPQQAAEGLWHEVVYYMRFGNLIKIGTTGTLYTRVRSLKPDEVMAAEPGSYDLEAKRHREFARYRAEGEYFYPAPALMDHVSKVRARHKAKAKRHTKTAIRNPVVAEVGEHLF